MFVITIMVIGIFSGLPSATIGGSSDLGPSLSVTGPHMSYGDPLPSGPVITTDDVTEVLVGEDYQVDYDALFPRFSYGVTLEPAVFPSARAGALTFWSGESVYLFGGGAGPTDEIFRYDPRDGSLTLLPERLPNSLYGGTVIDDGRHAYLLGGFSPELPYLAYTQQVLRFDPQDETIEELNVTSPGLGLGASGFWDGSHGYILGGSQDSDQIWRFDTQNLSFELLDVRLPRQLRQTSLVYDGQVAYLFGGMNATADHAGIIRFDPVSMTVTKMAATFPDVNVVQSAVWDGFYAYVFGGTKYTDMTSAEGSFHSNAVYRFDPRRDILVELDVDLGADQSLTSAVWTGRSALIFAATDVVDSHNRADQDRILSFEVFGIDRYLSPEAIFAHSPTRHVNGIRDPAVVWTGDWIYGFGGSEELPEDQKQTGYASSLTDIIWRFDPFTDRLEYLNTTLPTVLGGAAAVLIGDQVYLIGGTNGVGTAQILRFDLGSEVIEVMPTTLPRRLIGPVAFATGDSIYILGGFDSKMNASFHYRPEIYRYQLATGELTEMDSVLPHWQDPSNVIWTGRYAYSFGGTEQLEVYDTYSGSIGGFLEILRFDPLADELIVLNETLPVGGMGTSAVWSGELAYVFGGSGPNRPYVPEHVMVFDPTTETIIEEIPDYPLGWSSVSPVWAGDRAVILGAEIWDGVHPPRNLTSFLPAVNLTWSLDTSASFLSLASDTGILFGTPAEVDTGNWSVTVTVTDDEGRSDRHRFLLQVIDPHAGNDSTSNGSDPTIAYDCDPADHLEDLQLVESNHTKGALICTSMGNMLIGLDDRAPLTVANFEQYVKEGFYTGLIFHRIIDGFMIQGGGFEADMVRKTPPHPPIPLEVNGSLLHTDGAISMSRTNDPNSATTQFFICDGQQSFLDQQYAVFGQVLAGLEVVRSISAVWTEIVEGYSDVPIEDVIIEEVIWIEDLAAAIDSFDQPEKNLSAPVLVYGSIRLLHGGGDIRMAENSVVTLTSAVTGESHNFSFPDAESSLDASWYYQALLQYPGEDPIPDGSTLYLTVTSSLEEAGETRYWALSMEILKQASPLEVNLTLVPVAGLGDVGAYPTDTVVIAVAETDLEHQWRVTVTSQLTGEPISGADLNISIDPTQGLAIASEEITDGVFEVTATLTKEARGPWTLDIEVSAPGIGQDSATLVIEDPIEEGKGFLPFLGIPVMVLMILVGIALISRIRRRT